MDVLLNEHWHCSRVSGAGPDVLVYPHLCRCTPVGSKEQHSTVAQRLLPGQQCPLMVRRSGDDQLRLRCASADAEGGQLAEGNGTALHSAESGAATEGWSLPVAMARRPTGGSWRLLSQAATPAIGRLPAPGECRQVQLRRPGFSGKGSLSVLLASAAPQPDQPATLLTVLPLAVLHNCTGAMRTPMFATARCIQLGTPVGMLYLQVMNDLGLLMLQDIP